MSFGFPGAVLHKAESDGGVECSNEVVSLEFRSSAKEEARMPVIIHRTPTPPPARPAKPRSQQFNDAVRELAPIIAEIRKAGHHSIGDIAVCLEKKA